MAANLDGYFIRHYEMVTYGCTQWTTKMYLGNELMRTETEPVGGCHTYMYSWDEWIPYGSSDEIPDNGGGGGGGGPFFSPTDPLNREPTIDTMPDLDHQCDTWATDSTHLNQYRNLKCLDPLDDTLKMIIWDSLDQWIKPLNLIADTLARRECDSLATWFHSILSFHDNGLNGVQYDVIFKGRTDSVGPGKQPHDAQTGNLGSPGQPNIIHLDPKLWTKQHTVVGQKKMLGALFHESGHSWATLTHDTTLWAASNGYPNDPYFRSVSSCVL